MKNNLFIKVAMATTLSSVLVFSCKKETPFEMPQEESFGSSAAEENSSPPDGLLKEQLTVQDSIPENRVLWQRKAARYNQPFEVVPALLPTVGANGAPAMSTAGGSKLVTVGKAPKGYGTSFVWDRRQKEILLVMYINAADDMGATIENLRKWDVIQVTSASGIASFSKDRGNPLAGSIVSLIAAGAKVGASAAGYPQAGPLISAGEQFAKNYFKGTGSATKYRDAWGVEPGTGHKARQEGGLQVALPGAGGPFYSGNSDHRERWIKMPGTRYDRNQPDHMHHAFFPMRSAESHNRRQLTVSGFTEPVYVLSWDHAFGDNAGFYKVFVHIKKGTPPPPIP